MATPPPRQPTHQRAHSDGVMRHVREQYRSASPYASPCSSPKRERRTLKDVEDANTTPVESTPLSLVVEVPQIPAPKSAIECAICQSEMQDPTVGGGCAHHFCYDCYVEWTSRSNNCPTCRAPVWALAKDLEFASAIGAPCTPFAKIRVSVASKEEEAAADTRRVVRVFGPAGVTLCNNSDARGGCVITRLQSNNGARLAGLKTGDAVVAVNGTPVNDHSATIAMIDARTRLGDLELLIAPRTPSRISPSSIIASSPLADIRLARRSSNRPITAGPFAPAPGPTVAVPVVRHHVMA